MKQKLSTIKKKICFILPKFAPENIGGAELQVYYLANELIRRGFDISYIRHAPESYQLTRKFEEFSLYAIPNVKYFFMQSLNAFHLLSAMRKANADLYYCRVSKSYLPIVVWGSRRQKAISVWACSHDREVERFSPRTKRFLTKAQMYARLWLWTWVKSVSWCLGHDLAKRSFSCSCTALGETW